MKVKFYRWRVILRVTISSFALSNLWMSAVITTGNGIVSYLKNKVLIPFIRKCRESLLIKIMMVKWLLAINITMVKAKAVLFHRSLIHFVAHAQDYVCQRMGNCSHAFLLLAALMFVRKFAAVCPMSN